MATADLLRASRDGDQFHYHWAARQALKLLQPGTALAAIAIEGPSAQDTRERDGDEAVDLAEYYGNTDLHLADAVIYRQLKHSTTQATAEWTVSGLTPTLRKFAAKYRVILDEVPAAAKRVSFQFLSNRRSRPTIALALTALAAGRTTDPDAQHEVTYLSDALREVLSPEQVAAFCSRVLIDDRAPHLLELEHLFRADVAGFLVGAPPDAPLLLKEMVARRASSLEADHVIRRETVLSALRVPPDDLMPTPSLIRAPQALVPGGQTAAIAATITATCGRPILVHASAGVGKSVLAAGLGDCMPDGSAVLVYDCFGDGNYRNPSSPRHTPSRALLQLCNEFAAAGLADPVLPSPTAGSADYFRVFDRRVRTAAEALRATNDEALLVLVIDAADNAVLQAHDEHTQSFVEGLLRESASWPPNVRLVVTCRTERIKLLNPPAATERMQLQPFTHDQSRQHLFSRFPDVDVADAAEFHRLTSGNPRVQVQVLANATTAAAALATLDAAAGMPGEIFDALLAQRIHTMQDTHSLARIELERLCAALASLRPRIPLRLLADVCSIDPSVIRSFAADLGSSLHVDEETVQFRDEPTETWFRMHFRLAGDALNQFISRLRPLADVHPYAAASLPQLLWEAGQAEELVRLALSDDALPSANDLERRQVAQQRAQFALKANLRAGHHLNSARLALRSGVLAAGHTRQTRLLRQHTDLSAQFLELATVEDLIASRALTGDWPGANLPYEAALLSGAPGRQGHARTRLRSAQEWMHTWVRAHYEKDAQHHVTDDDIAEVAWALVNTEGAEACSAYLARWQPDGVSYDVGLIVARRLLDAGRIDDVESLAWAGQRLKYLQLAAAEAAAAVHQVLSRRVTRRLVAMLVRHRQPLPLVVAPDHGWPRRDRLRGILWIVALGLRHACLSPAGAERILRLYLPAQLSVHAASSPHRETETLLKGFGLLARVGGASELDVDAITPAGVRNAPAYVYDRQIQEFKDNIGPLAPWVDLWVDTYTATQADPGPRLTDLIASSLTAIPNREPPGLFFAVAARTAGWVLAACPTPAESAQRTLRNWCLRYGRRLGRAALLEIVTATAPDPVTQPLAIDLAADIVAAVETERVDAQEKADDLVALARAVYRFSPGEARAHFTRAVEITMDIGDDAYPRWEALLTAARAAADPELPDDERAYRVAQVYEGLDPFFGERLDATGALRVIGRLSPRNALTIAARWRDRRTVYLRSLAHGLLTDPGGVFRDAPVAALAFLAFDDRADVSQLQKRAAAEHTETAVRVQEYVDEATRPWRTTSAGSPAYQPPPAPNLSRTWLDRSDSSYEARAAAARDTLAGFDLTSFEGWNRGREFISDRGVPLHLDDLVAGVEKLPLPALAGAIDAFTASSAFGVFAAKTLLDVLDRLPRLPQSAHAALVHMARTLASRFCVDLTTRSYDLIDPIRLAAVARLSEAQLQDSALQQLGTLPQALDAEQCLGLAGRLSQRLDRADAAQFLDDCLQSFDGIVAAAADGPPAAGPQPPATVSEAIAGFIWAALGDAEGSTRWRSAHAVHALLLLGCRHELAALSRLAEQRDPDTAFSDPRLVFYRKHASQWLLFALARAATDPRCHESLEPFIPLLVMTLTAAEPHVVMQATAKAAVQSLLSAGVNVPTVQDTVLTATARPVGVVSVEWGRHPTRTIDLDLVALPTPRPGGRGRSPARATSVSGAQRDDPPEAQADEGPPRRFRFFYDFGAYWCRPLARAFGVTEGNVEQLVEQVIVDLWALPYTGDAAQDQRHGLNLYSTGATHTYKYDRPTEHDLDFYLSIHALYTVAGHLMQQLPVHQVVGTKHSEFDEWLKDHLPTRADGRWLADRRDAPPARTTPPQTDDPTGDGWQYSVARSYLDDLLTPAANWMTVWADHRDSYYNASETVRVSSALVSPTTSTALLRALQTTRSHDFRLPHLHDDDAHISHLRYELTGWVAPEGDSDGADREDPLGAAVAFPPPRPAATIADTLRLTADPDLRSWHRDGQIVMRSTVWSDVLPESRGRETGSRGTRLDLHTSLLPHLLTMTARDLIVVVEVQRQLDERSPRGREDDADEFTYLDPYFKVYLFDAKGHRREF